MIDAKPLIRHLDLVIQRAPMAGRADELAALIDAMAGRPAVPGLVITGEAGIGKSRLVAAGQKTAAELGVLVVVGGCLRLSVSLPFLPFVDALRMLADRPDPSPVSLALRACAPFVSDELARLLPELRPAATHVLADGDGMRRVRLFDSVRSVLAALPTPAAVVVEDLHWADASTLELCEYLLDERHRTGVPLILTCRAEEMDERWLTATIVRAGLPCIDVTPLSYQDTAVQVAGLLGRPVKDADVAAVHRRTGGHPFYTEQLVSASVDSVGAELPVGLRSILLQRVADTRPDQRKVLNVLALAERPVPETMLAELTGWPQERMRVALRPLIGTRLVAEADAGYLLRHALLGEAMRTHLLVGEQRELHRALAQVMAAQADVAAAEIAAHYAAAADDADELRWRVRAGRHAESARAAADALVHWRRAVELCAGLPDGPGVAGMAVAELLMHCSWANEHLGRPAEAGADAERALAALPVDSAGPLAAQAHRVVGHWRTATSAVAGEQMLRTAVQLYEPLPPSRDKARAQWLLSNAMFQARGGFDDEQQCLLDDALSVGRQCGAAGTERMLCAVAAFKLLYSGDRDGALRGVEQALGLPRDERDPQATIAAGTYAVDLLNRCGAWTRALDIGSAELGWAEKHGYTAAFPTVQLLAYVVETLCKTGRVAEATGRLATGDWTKHRDIVDNHLAYLHCLNGDVTTAARMWVEQRDQLARLPVGFQGEFTERGAEIELWAGRPAAVIDAALPVLDGCTKTDSSRLVGGLLVLTLRACGDLARHAHEHRNPAELDSAHRAHERASALAAACRHDPFAGPVPATARADGLTWAAERSRLLGEQDPEPWDAAVDGWRDVGLPHRAAYAGFRQAEALLAHRSGRGRAVTVLRDAANVAAGHVPLVQSIRQLAGFARLDLDEHVAAPVAVPIDVVELPRPFGLTGRELAVLRRLGAGESNAQIGRSLYISTRTVGVHVSNILRKIGVTSRVQAAAVASRLGLLDEP